MASLLLRPWHGEDAVNLHSIFGATPDLNTQFAGTLDSVESAREFITSNLGWRPDAACNFAVRLDGRAVGNIGLTNIKGQHRTAWTSYWVSGDVRGLGLAARGAASVAIWAVNELDLFRLELGHRTNNPASCRAATKAGFAPEGIDRSKLQNGDRRFDVETHVRLASDPLPALEPITMFIPGRESAQRRTDVAITVTACSTA